MMDRKKLAAIALMAAGILALAYSKFTYTEDTHEAKIGSLSVSIDDRRRVDIPVWVGAGMLLVGGLMFANGLKKG